MKISLSKLLRTLQNKNLKIRTLDHNSDACAHAGCGAPSSPNVNITYTYEGDCSDCDCNTCNCPAYCINVKANISVKVNKTFGEDCSDTDSCEDCVAINASCDLTLYKVCAKIDVDTETDPPTFTASLATPDTGGSSAWAVKNGTCDFSEYYCCHTNTQDGASLTLVIYADSPTSINIVAYDGYGCLVYNKRLEFTSCCGQDYTNNTQADPGQFPYGSVSCTVSQNPITCEGFELLDECINVSISEFSTTVSSFSTSSCPDFLEIDPVWHVGVTLGSYPSCEEPTACACIPTDTLTCLELTLESAEFRTIQCGQSGEAYQTCIEACNESVDPECICNCERADCDEESIGWIAGSECEGVSTATPQTIKYYSYDDGVISVAWSCHGGDCTDPAYWFLGCYGTGGFSMFDCYGCEVGSILFDCGCLPDGTSPSVYGNHAEPFGCTGAAPAWECFSEYIPNPNPSCSVEYSGGTANITCPFFKATVSVSIESSSPCPVTLSENGHIDPLPCGFFT